MLLFIEPRKCYVHLYAVQINRYWLYFDLVHPKENFKSEPEPWFMPLFVDPTNFDLFFCATKSEGFEFILLWSIILSFQFRRKCNWKFHAANLNQFELKFQALISKFEIEVHSCSYLWNLKNLFTFLCSPDRQVLLFSTRYIPEKVWNLIQNHNSCLYL